MYRVIDVEDSTSDTTASDMLFRRSFYEGTELDAIDENDPVRFSYVPTVHSTANPDEDSDPDTCIIGTKFLLPLEVLFHPRFCHVGFCL